MCLRLLFFIAPVPDICNLFPMYSYTVSGSHALRVSRSQGLTVSESNGIKVSRSQGLTVSGSQYNTWFCEKVGVA